MLKKIRFLALIFIVVSRLHAQQADTSLADVSLNGSFQNLLKAGATSYFVDAKKSAPISRIIQTPFTVPYDHFISLINKEPAIHTFWLKFDLRNLSDIPLQVYLYCGDVDFTEIYFITGNQSMQYIQGGNLRGIHGLNSFLPKITRTSLIRLQAREQGVIYLKIEQKTEEFNYNGISLYDKPGIYQTIGEDYMFTRHFYIFQLLFQGILICQLIYVLFQWMIIRRKEYLYYFFYLLVIALYFLSKYEYFFRINLLFVRYPLLTVYLNKTLLILPYFFYFRFVRSFLEMSKNYPVMNKWISRIEYFLLAYLIFDLSFILATFNVKLQRELYSYILLTVFIASAFFIFYLFRQKKTLIYYIVSGSLIVGLGNIIGLVITYLQNENIVQSVPYILMYSQAGIILEIFCFTAGLSYKSMSAEKEKIKSQENLIEQLKANELLQSKMQHIRNKIAQDLHDDIGSTLSSISILSNMALKEKNDKQTMATMHEIKDSSVTLMEKMDDIVWSINPRNDSMENLLMRIKRFATTLFEAKNIDYSISIQENMNKVKLPMEYRQHIYLILKEAINNLVKYAEATNAIIQVSYDGSILKLLLQDNGRGFDQAKPYTGNGLPGMRNRADLMNAELIIQSVIGEGSQVSLLLKIK